MLFGRLGGFHDHLVAARLGDGVAHHIGAHLLQPGGAFSSAAQGAADGTDLRVDAALDMGAADADAPVSTSRLTAFLRPLTLRPVSGCTPPMDTRRSSGRLEVV